MSIDNYNLFYIITGIFDTYITFIFMSAFYERENINKRFEVFSYILYFLSTSFAYIFFNIPVVALIVNIGTLIIISLNYKADIKKRIFVIAFIYIILMLIEGIVWMLSGYTEISVLQSNKKYFSEVGVIIAKILMYIAALVIKSYKNIKSNVYMPGVYWMSIIFIPITSLLIILSIIEMADVYSNNIFLIISGLLLMNFIVFYLYDSLAEKQEEKLERIMLLQQGMFYQKQFENMETSFNAIKVFRHDVKNYLYVLNSLVENEEKEAALKHIAHVTGALDVNTEYARSGNVMIDGILNLKLQEAQQRGIDVKLELTVPESINITSFDMSVILGNLLDNAINAATKVLGEKGIKTIIKYKRGRLIIQVSNSYNGQLKYMGTELVTTAEDKENHGIGIKNVRSALSRYNGEIEIEHTQSIFTVTLLMFLNE